MISSRNEVTQMIVSAKVAKGLKWGEIAEKVGQSKEWTTAACLGQMTLNKTQAEIMGEIFGLSEEAVAWLQIVPYKGSLPSAVPTDPLIYRWYEIVSVYGTTIKELIHEEFGDGIMSAIDFSMDIQREADPKGDRVKVVLSGKFLPYKSY
ncbi:cyanase [Caballeronia mineralivorans]|jgi:cyanate lyase|uniref:cyanase n=1 Tax=Caballeronia mineralivorans TaxID=2010198 RepID=UPI000EFAF7BA|nr:cyanase [Caballeronia mineralivorans]MDB5782706.1 cyanate hydratase [Caballeronia mineralivorans]MEA3098352.1 cyanate lyase [Caballeronia mineralivorans]